MTAGPLVADLDELISRRAAPAQRLADDAETVARACHAMAERFHRGGKLIVFGDGGRATDAQHIAVEFLHPVIVGTRALPAISLTNDVSTLTGVAVHDGYDEVFAAQLRLVGEADDIALGLLASGPAESVRRGLAAARERGLLTLAMVGGSAATPVGADHVLAVPSDDPRIVKEVMVTAYHILWELVHVYLDQPGVLGTKALG